MANFDLNSAASPRINHRAPMFAGKRLENYPRVASSPNTSDAENDNDTDTTPVKSLKSTPATTKFPVFSNPSSDSDIPVLITNDSDLNEHGEEDDSDANDDDDDAEEDDDDSDFSVDSTTVFLPQLLKSTSLKIPVVIPPAKLDIPTSKLLNIELPLDSTSESDSDLSIMSESALEELEASILPLSKAISAQESEYNDETLLAILSDEDSSIADADTSDFDSSSDEDNFFDYEDDHSIEQREERAILEEVKFSGDLEDQKVVYNSDSSESDVSFNNDNFFEPRPLPTKSITSTPVKAIPSDEDESYLFSYFFTTEDESETEKPSLENYSANALAVAMDDGDDSDYGDSTDEDSTLPKSNPYNKSKPTEILSTSATTSRPPVLGSWVMSTELPYGIIDGLTTRTLSPPTSTLQPNSGSTNGSQSTTQKRPRNSITSLATSDSEASELALEDFIYTSELDDKEDKSAYAFDDPAYHPVNKDIPLSAFRNRSSYSQLSFQQPPLHRRLSTPSRRNSREISLTPVKPMPRHLRKRHKHTRKKDLSRLSLDPRTIQESEMEDIPAAGLIDELIGVGALSPLFGGIA